MHSQKCAVCGQVNRADAKFCEICESSLGQAADAGAGQTFNSSYSPHYAEEPREGALPTDIPSPRFQGAGDVIPPTLDVYRKNFLLVGLLVVAASLPMVVLQLGSYYMLSAWAGRAANTRAASAFVVLGVSAGVLSYLLTIVVNAFLMGALAHAIVELQMTGEAKAGDSIRWGLAKLPKVFAVSLLYGIITLAGYVLLIVPGVIFSLMFALAAPVAAIENRGVIESLKRSRELTDGYKGLIFLTFFLWGIAVAVVGFIVGGSFALAGAQQASAAPLLLQTLIQEMLNSTTIVLTVFIFLGVLNERRQGFETRTFTPAPEPSER